MNAGSLIGFIIGFGLIVWVLLANAEASPQRYGDGDRARVTEECLVR
jgi:hypothetical protein